MKRSDTIINRLFDDYKKLNPSVEKIHQLFSSSGESIINDHIAFRTINHPDININILAKPFLERGYKEKGHYRFEQKKLKAKHFEMEENPDAPKIFISELCTEDLPAVIQDLISKHIITKLKPDYSDDEILFSGNTCGPPEYHIYEQLLNVSEYAAWFYVFGFRANHFTVLVNRLRHFRSLESVNTFLKDNGYTLNSAGGEIKGTPDMLLEQSSTLADMVTVTFTDGPHRIPACYYEFARRYTNPNGTLFNGFIAQSADKIFESTNYRKK